MMLYITMVHYTCCMSNVWLLANCRTLCNLKYY